jgi:hypothetical protein
MQKLEISPMGFTRGVKTEIEKIIFSICPKLLVNAELYGLVLAPKTGKKDLGNHFATLEANVPAFINILMSMF